MPSSEWSIIVFKCNNSFIRRHYKTILIGKLLNVKLLYRDWIDRVALKHGIKLFSFQLISKKRWNTWMNEFFGNKIYFFQSQAATFFQTQMYVVSRYIEKLMNNGNSHYHFFVPHHQELNFRPRNLVVLQITIVRLDSYFHSRFTFWHELIHAVSHTFVINISRPNSINLIFLISPKKLI